MGSNKELRENFGRKYAEDKFDGNYLPTLGVDVTTQRISVNKTHIKLIIVDTAGEEFFGKLRPNYYRGSSGGIIAYESNEEKPEQNQVERFYKEFRQKVDDSRVPVAIVKSSLKSGRE